MKALLATILISYCAAIGGITTSVLNQVDSKAQPDQVQGLYIYYKSKPVSETEYLGTVKAGITWSGSPAQLLNKLLKKVKDDYPAAQGIIVTADMDKADAVKFK